MLSGCAALARAGETEYPRFPDGKPGSSFAAKMPEATDLFTEGTGLEPLRSVVSSDQWDYARHPVSGEITRRVFYAWFGWEQEPGYCELGEYWFYQESTGPNRWSNLRFGGQASGRYDYRGGKIDCAELQAPSSPGTATPGEASAAAGPSAASSGGEAQGGASETSDEEIPSRSIGGP